MKIECSNLKCKYMGEKGICKAKKVNLSLNIVDTEYQGRQDFLRCNTFEKDEEYIEMEKIVKKLLFGGDEDE